MLQYCADDAFKAQLVTPNTPISVMRYETTHNALQHPYA